jgi:O-antigen/teichoic acid export membrane protein
MDTATDPRPAKSHLADGNQQVNSLALNFGHFPARLRGLWEYRERATASLRANFAWTLVGNGVYSGCQWGLLVLLAKLGSPEMVGQFALGLAISMPVIMLANLNLRSVLTTDVGRRLDFGHYLGFRLITSVLALIIIAAIVLLAGHSREPAQVVLMVAVAQIVEAVSDVYYGLFQLRERMDRIAVGPASLVVMGVLVFATGSVFWGAFGLAMARLAVLLLYDIPVSIRGERGEAVSVEAVSGVRPRFDKAAQWSLLRCSFPLGIVALLVSLNTNVPRYFIQGSLGERALGIFSAIAFLLSSGNLIVGALGQAAFVRLATHYARSEMRDFGHLLLRLLGIGAVLGIGGIVVARFFGEVILSTLFKPEYAQEAHLLVWLMVAAAIGYLGQFIGYAMTAARYFRSQIPLFLMVVISAALSSAHFIPLYGLLGAIYALLISMLVQLAGSIIVLGWGIRRRTMALSRLVAEAE